jgi:crotonobetainyl-CoA:carnitine CoA-transferase CaiB-like acyl-CoA transferase
MLAGLYARAVTGRGQRVATSLLGAGMLLQSGVYQSGGRIVAGPHLDANQTGYGPGYRLYEGGDGEWFALVLPDPAAWERMRAFPETAALAPTYAPLRGGERDGAAREAEAVLESAFASAAAADWVARLRAGGLPAELIRPADRDRYRQGILDDPVNRQLGRVAAYDTAEWGHFEQIGPLLRCGPEMGSGPRPGLPGIGEHSVAVLTELGFSADAVNALLDAKVARQL